MKKIFTLLTMFMVSLMAIAQTNPNRLIVQHKSGTTGYLAERIDSIYFAKVEGRVAADVTVAKFTDSDGYFGQACAAVFQCCKRHDYHIGISTVNIPRLNIHFVFFARSHTAPCICEFFGIFFSAEPLNHIADVGKTHHRAPLFKLLLCSAFFE